MRTLARAAGVGLIVLTGLGLGCDSSSLVTRKDGGGDAMTQVDRDGGATREDASGPNQDSSLPDSNLGGGGQDAVAGPDTSVGGSDTGGAKSEVGADTRAVDTGGGGRTVGLLGQCENGAGGTCAGAAAFSTCMTDNCESDLRDCFGPGYASGSFAGPCADYMNCLWKCPCDASAKTCQDSCTSLLSAGTCVSCLTGSWCMLTSCGGPPACILPTLPGPDGGIRVGIDGGVRVDGGSFGGCAAAAACCEIIESRMGPSFGQICKSAVSGSTDAQCDSALEQYGAFCS